MKILLVGKNNVIVKNLVSLGANVTVSKNVPYKNNKYDGIVIARELPFYYMDELRAFNTPIIVFGTSNFNRNIDILVYSEEEAIKVFGKLDSAKLKGYKDKLKNLGINYLVASFGKEKIQRYIDNLPTIETKLNVTKETVDKAKEVVTAVVTYIYLKTGKLSADVIKQANIDTITTIGQNAKDYYLNIRRKS